MSDKTIESVRGDIERRLWKEYDPDLAPNMEKLTDDILEIVCSTLERECEGMKDVRGDMKEIGGGGWYEGYNAALDAVSEKIKKLMS